ncbi:MAG: threonine--tRNA ligase [Candidatus Dojkabacteria bacterium]|nr:MAG: threonine--tRNA ligase [Candidatus Dojkabacteria bacterium]
MILNFSEEELYKINHSAEHIFAQAVKELYGDKVVLAVAHITERGFSNDARWSIELTEDMLTQIEKKMHEIIKADLEITAQEVTFEQAMEMFKDNPFKQEWIKEHTEAGKTLTIYWTGDQYYDLCKGPHVSRTSEIGAFKLLSISGAYWRGDEKNEMLTRVHGTAWPTKEALSKYLEMLEEAKKRDHKKIMKEQDLIVFSELVGSGLPLWTPRGAVIRRELERFIVDEEIKRGYQHVYTPDIANLELYRKSGHYPYYKDSMYAPITIDDEEYMLRPMTCPHHFQLYLSRPRSYKELPMRIAELAKLYRYEKSGELTGLIRVRSFCLADAHIVTMREKAEQEIENALELIEYICHLFGLKPNEDYSYRLSLGDRQDDKKYYKDDESWDYAENVLRNVLKKRVVKSVEAQNEAAFYGPKIDIQMRNVNGKEDTAFTVQYDFVMPKRFGLKFINQDGNEEEAVVIHRSSVGAIERTIAFLIERFNGSFPLWLHPEQVAIIPVSDKVLGYAIEIKNRILEKIPNARIELMDESEKIQKKIRNAQLKKIPYMLILGEKERLNQTVNVRLRTEEVLGEMQVDSFIDRLGEKIKSKSLEL